VNYLISARKALVKAFTFALPQDAPLIHLPDITALHRALISLPGSAVQFAPIIVDAEQNPQIVAECRQMCRRFARSPVIIALIAHSEARQAVLEAGADDYLLLPLIPVEIQARLSLFQRSAAQSLNHWIEAIYAMNKGLSTGQTLDQAVEYTAQVFNAAAGWLYVINPARQVKLLGSYNLPPLPEDEVNRYIERFAQDAEGAACLISAPGAMGIDPQLPHYLTIPLRGHQTLSGLLALAYRHPPQISRIERLSLAQFGVRVGTLLEIVHLQEEAQIYAIQNAFMVLIARALNERLDLNTVLSLSLEQAVPLLNATGGDIWLLSDDKQWLELASSLMPAPAGYPVTRRAKRQGLFGWVIEQGRWLNIEHSPPHHPRFDPRVDRIKEVENCALLAIPLRHREEIIGVMAFYNKHGIPFTPPDIVLLESIANLVASAIANARLMQELRDFADQQRVLYEMSQQIAAGLDLKATLNRVLLWIDRLVDVQTGLLWLLEAFSDKRDAVTTLHLVAVQGIYLSQEEGHIITPDQGLIGWVARNGKSAVVNNPAHDPRSDSAIINVLGAPPRNIIAVPMFYHDQIIGVVSLYNKLEGDFTEDDLTLLSTAIEMAAVTVGNARLHAQTIKLLDERERLHKQIIQSERLITVGRLTASISHEINNPMQTIRTALVLAREELHDPRKLETYLQMSLEESERIVQLVNRMRQIYRPHGDVPETLEVNELLREAATIARKELRRKQVTIEANLAPKLPLITAIADQLHLVFLSLMLSLGDALGEVGGGRLRLQSSVSPQAIYIELITDKSLAAVANWRHIFMVGTPSEQKPPRSDEAEVSFGLAFCYEIIVAHGGAINIKQDDRQTMCRLELPLILYNLDTKQATQLPLPV
jgi:GAF domain-containing protein